MRLLDVAVGEAEGSGHSARIAVRIGQHGRHFAAAHQTRGLGGPVLVVGGGGSGSSGCSGHGHTEIGIRGVVVGGGCGGGIVGRG